MYSEFLYGHLIDSLLWNVDLLLVMLVSLGAMGGIFLWTRFAPECRRLLYVSSSLLFLVLAFGAYDTRSHDLLARHYWNDRLFTSAKSLAVAVGNMGLEDITADASAETDPAYRRLLHVFEAWQTQDDMIVNVCTFRRNADGDFIYLVRPGADYNDDGKIVGELEEYALPGKNYGKAMDEPVLLNTFRTGKPQFTDFPYYADGLPWLYASVPVCPEGQAFKDMILVVDFKASQWLENVRTARRGPLWGVVFIVFLILSATVEIILLQRALRNTTRAKDQLAENELKYRKIIDNSHDAIALVEDGYYVFCNKKMREWFALPDTPNPERQAGSLSPSQQPEGFDSREEFMRRVRLAEQGARQVFPWTLLRRDGVSFQAQVHLDPVEIDGKILVTDVVHDQTPDQRAAEAEQASKTKSDFLAQMSHEIRTPLNGVIGLSDLLLGTELSPKQLEYARLVRESGKSLLFLINDILDFSKIEAGKLEIAHEPFDPVATVHSVLGILTSRATEKHLELRSATVPEIPRRVFGDEGRLRQILLNLVGNAIKFTETGGITIEVSLVPEAEPISGRCTIRFAVIDTGIGIPEKHLHRLGEAFTQVDSSSERRLGGTGLGLAICKLLIGLMNGEAGVESTVGRGSTFWLTLPLEIDPENLSVEESEPQESGIFVFPESTEPRTILVAEDNRINQMVVRETLLVAGFDCEVVDNGRKAVEAMKNGHFHLILMDCQMPEMDGFQATHAIREYETTTGKDKRIPIVALTASATTEDANRCIDAGMDAFCTKPINAKELVKVIRFWFDRC